MPSYLLKRSNIFKFKICPRALIPSTPILILLLASVVGITHTDNAGKNIASAQSSLQNQTRNQSMNTHGSVDNITDVNQIVTVFPADFTRAMDTIASVQNN